MFLSEVAQFAPARMLAPHWLPSGRMRNCLQASWLHLQSRTLYVLIRPQARLPSRWSACRSNREHRTSLTGRTRSTKILYSQTYAMLCVDEIAVDICAVDRVDDPLESRCMRNKQRLGAAIRKRRTELGFASHGEVRSVDWDGPCAIRAHRARGCRHQRPDFIRSRRAPRHRPLLPDKRHDPRRLPACRGQ